jgi:hypothetical protein
MCFLRGLYHTSCIFSCRHQGRYTLFSGVRMLLTYWHSKLFERSRTLSRMARDLIYPPSLSGSHGQELTLEIGRIYRWSYLADEIVSMR